MLLSIQLRSRRGSCSPHHLPLTPRQELRDSEFGPHPGQTEIHSQDESAPTRSYVVSRYWEIGGGEQETPSGEERKLQRIKIWPVLFFSLWDVEVGIRL